MTLLFGVKIASVKNKETAKKEPFFITVKAGLTYLRNNDLILVLILFLAGVNFVASAFDA